MQLALGVTSKKLDLQAYDLKTAILYTLAYSDIFEFPLSVSEIERYLISYKATETEILTWLQTDSSLGSQVISDGELFALTGRAQLFEQRKKRALFAKDLWAQSRRYGELIAGLPFVRMVAVTGALAADNVESGADLDYLIVTRRGTLWLTRGMILALDRIAARHGQQARLCPNFLISEDALTLEDRDLFTAQELARMVPIAGQGTYDKMRALNAWTNEFLPNAHGSPNGRGREANGWSKSIAEFVLANPATRLVENWEMQRKIAKFSNQQKANGEARFSADYCKGHFDGHKQQTMLAFEERIAKIKLNGK